MNIGIFLTAIGSICLTFAMLAICTERDEWRFIVPLGVVGTICFATGLAVV